MHLQVQYMVTLRISTYSDFKITRKSSCVTARGAPSAAHPVHSLSCPGRGYPCPGPVQGGGVCLSCSCLGRRGGGEDWGGGGTPVMILTRVHPFPPDRIRAGVPLPQKGPGTRDWGTPLPGPETSDQGYPLPIVDRQSQNITFLGTGAVKIDFSTTHG